MNIIREKGGEEMQLVKDTLKEAKMQVVRRHLKRDARKAQEKPKAQRISESRSTYTCTIDMPCKQHLNPYIEV